MIKLQNKYQLRELAHENLKPSSKEFVPRSAFNKDKTGDVFENPLLAHYDKFWDVKERSFPFMQTICNVLKGPREYEKQNAIDATQYLLLGKPSSGKTTELRRIAHEILDQINDDNIIHLCSLQNTSSVQREIESKQDLWNWIMRSHESRVWAEDRYSLEQFSQLHRDNNLKPILLVDTVDLLIYGKIGTESSMKITEFWKELVSDIELHGWTVLWSCRKYEWNLMKKHNSADRINLIEVSLPILNEKEITQRLESISTADYLQRHMVTLSWAFPIVIGHYINYKQKFDWAPIIENFRKLHHEMRRTSCDERIVVNNAGPVSWIARELNEQIATDILYKGIRSAIIDYIVKVYHYGLEEVKNRWEDIEKEFYSAARPKSSVSRIQIDSSYLEDYDDKTLTEALIKRAVGFGILNKNGETIEMTHQLFAEYCVWLHKKNTDRELMKKFPSTIFRSELKNADQAVLNEGKDWFLPYILFNMDLAKFPDLPSFEKSTTRAWKKLADFARHEQKSEYPKTKAKHIENHNVPFNHSRLINEEKEQLLDNLNSTFPLIINGPPGVGKSHLSYIWIDKMALGSNWEQLLPDKERQIFVADINALPTAFFMTQSQRLASQISDKIDEYYGVDTRPVKFENWGVSEYLADLEKLLGIKCETYSFEDFEKEWKEYSKGNSTRGIADLNKMSIQALWNEYLHNVIDNQGDRKDFEKYRKSIDHIFKYCKHPVDAKEVFGKWAIERRKRSPKLSLSEQAGQCIKKVLPILANGNLQQRELIHTMQPDILVLDEIQDLPAPVILLMLIMHKGETNTVMMCGDDEQTLELIQFNWSTVFKHISVAIHELYESYKEDSESIIFIEKWVNIQDQSLNKIQEKNTSSLKMVERNIPEIVDVLSQSWRTSVTSLEVPDEIKINRNKGTGAIIAGKFSRKREELNKKNDIDQGVEYHEVKNTDWFKKVATEIYDQALDVAILLPDLTQWERYKQLLEQWSINIEIWTPRKIKGLEYSVVIAVNPWHIDKEHFTDVIGKSITTWSKAEQYVTDNHGISEHSDAKINAIALLANQRRRHSNIMLSRGMDQLFIISENESGMIETKDPNFMDLQKTILDDNADLFGEKTNKSNYQGINRLIKRLSMIILSVETESDRNQVMYKSKHILQTLKLDENVEDYLPFYLLSKITSDHFDEDENNDLLGVGLRRFNRLSSLTSPLEVEDDSTYGKWSDFDELQNFWEYIGGLVSSIKEDQGRLNIPILLFNEYNSKLEEFILLFSRPNDSCFKQDNTLDSKEKESQKNIISDYIVNRIFGGQKESEIKAEQWCTAAKTINLSTFSITLNVEKNPRYKLLLDIIKQQQELSDSSVKSSNKSSSKSEFLKIDTDFWKEGSHHLSRIDPYDLFDISKRICSQLTESSNSLSNEGVIFLSKLIPRSLKERRQELENRFNSGGITELCKICNALEKQASNNKISLPLISSQIEDYVSQIIANKLFENIAKPSVRKALLGNSFGLYDLFKSKIMVTKNKEFNLGKAMQLGRLLVKDLSPGNKPPEPSDWELPIITDLQNFATTEIGRDRFVTTTYIEDMKIEDVETIFWNENTKNHKKEEEIQKLYINTLFATSLRYELDDRGRKNLVFFLIKKIYIDNWSGYTIKRKEKGMRESIAEKINLLPLKQSEEDSKKWNSILDDEEFTKKLVSIPYESALADIDPDIYFGRNVDGFGNAKKWNNSLKKELIKLNRGKGMKSAIDEIQKRTDSAYDAAGAPEPGTPEYQALKINTHEHLRKNVSSRSWREQVLRKDNKNLTSGWANDFIPNLTAKQSIILYSDLFKIKMKLDKSYLRFEKVIKAMKGKLDSHNLLQTQSLTKKGITWLKNKSSDAEMEIFFTAMLDEVRSFDMNSFLEKFVNYFHTNTKLKKQWKSLSSSFLEVEYPMIYELLGQFGIKETRELLDDITGSSRGIHEFSLANIPLESQRILIKFLQLFGKDEKYIPATNPKNLDSSETIGNYQVLKPQSKHLRATYKRRDLLIVKALPYWLWLEDY